MKEEKSRSNLREKADKIKEFRCKNLIVVIENPSDVKNLGTIIRNVNALGAEKAYVIDKAKILPDDWQDMRQEKILSKASVSAVKWTFVKRFDDTEACIKHLQKNGFSSVVTSPHMKGKKNVDLDQGDFTRGKLAVWFGNEAIGISDLAVEHSEMCVNIPMYGIIESLNLGTSTGIVLYEITKQRRAFQEKRLAKASAKAAKAI